MGTAAPSNKTTCKASDITASAMPVSLSKRDRPSEPSRAFERKRQIALSGSVEVLTNETALYKTSVQRRTGSLLMGSLLTETE